MQIFKFITAFVFSLLVVATSLKTEARHRRFGFKISTPDRSGHRLKGDMGSLRDRRHIGFVGGRFHPRAEVGSSGGNTTRSVYHGRF